MFGSLYCTVSKVNFSKAVHFFMKQNYNYLKFLSRHICGDCHNPENN